MVNLVFMALFWIQNAGTAHFCHFWHKILKLIKVRLHKVSWCSKIEAKELPYPLQSHKLMNYAAIKREWNLSPIHVDRTNGVRENFSERYFFCRQVVTSQRVHLGYFGYMALVCGFVFCLLGFFCSFVFCFVSSFACLRKNQIRNEDIKTSTMWLHLVLSTGYKLPVRNRKKMCSTRWEIGRQTNSSKYSYV